MDLSHNKIGDKGIKQLSLIIATQEEEILKIKSLDVSHNSIGPSGGKFILERIGMSSILKEINLSYNDIGNETVARFVSAIETNKLLLKLDLSFNGVHLKHLDDIAHIMARNEGINSQTIFRKFKAE